MIIAAKTTFSDFLNKINLTKDPALEFEKAVKKFASTKMDWDKYCFKQQHFKFYKKLNVVKYAPPDLNNLTWGELTYITAAENTDEILFNAAEILIKKSKQEILESPAYAVLSFLNFVKSELERIAKLFAEIEYKPSIDEKKAGIDKLNFGLFGTIDWWAKRMGITDHEEAEKTKWIRIYKCMKNDNATAEYQRRFSNILMNKKK